MSIKYYSKFIWGFFMLFLAIFWGPSDTILITANISAVIGLILSTCGNSFLLGNNILIILLL